ncbi:MAG: type II toxin-antitoxin system RelE/ParE family toxin [Oscillospiraceae bacterium]|nr:type II toxin-antitoxin system RelE/ParE family toxin [Oscillospiraceae bacterium]
MDKPIKVKYEKKAVKFLGKTEQSVKLKIKEAIKGLTETPPKGDIKPLQGYDDERKRLRYGKYRIIFRLEESNNAEYIKILLIMNIGSRGDIYKEG